MWAVPRDDLRRVLGACAVAGPVLFTVASLIAGSVQDEYSPRREDISALAAIDAQHAWIMIGGIIALALGLLALGLGLVNAIDDGASAKVAPVLLVLAGLCFAVAGLARNDCSSELDSCQKRVAAGDVSWHHNVHDLVGVAAFLLLVAAPFVLARAFRADSRWSDLRRYSLVTGALALALLLVALAEIEGWTGLVQRLLLAVVLLWIAVLGTRLAREPTRPAPGPDVH
jgi:hypothetical membrane protein